MTNIINENYIGAEIIVDEDDDLEPLTMTYKNRYEKCRAETYVSTMAAYEKYLLERSRIELELYVNSSALEFLSPALAGDIGAASRLSVELSNDCLGQVAISFWEARVKVPAFAAFLSSVWVRDHMEIRKAVRTCARLESMFNYAKLPVPELRSASSIARRLRQSKSA